MARMVRGLYVSPDCVKVCEVDDDRGCAGYYELLDCEMIESPEFYFKPCGVYMDMICDEEALCHEETPPCTAAILDRDGLAAPWIHGACFVCRADDEGNWISLTDDELAKLKSAIGIVDGRFVLVIP